MLEEYWLQIAREVIFGQYNGPLTGPLVLGVHGLSKRNGWHTWGSLLEPLGQAGFLALSLDLPGWGQSSAWGSDSLSPGDAVQCLMSIANNLKKDNFVVMGKSWGGAVAIQAAIDFPERVNGLILTAPAFLQYDRLGLVSQPVLLVWSQDDPVIPVKYAKTIKDSIPDAELVIYEKGGHSAAPANSTDFAPRAIEFLHSLFGLSDKAISGQN